MTLEEILLDYLRDLAYLRTSHSFGWKCIFVGKRMIGGYKVIDDNILLIFLILSPHKLIDSLENGFNKFGFGQTWSQTEISGEDDLIRIRPFFSDAIFYSKERTKKMQ